MSERSIVICLTFVALMAGCDGGSTSAPKRFKFRTFNVSECREFQLDLDLEAAGAVLARLNDEPDCSLSPVLDGCDVLFEEVDQGRKLRATIANCVLPLNTSLFDCGFTTADVKTLESAADAYCQCQHEPVCDWNSVCNQGPPVCVNEEGGVTGCESCNNGIDDNGNGDVDCADDDCRITEVCGWGWTTVTCPNTTVDSVTLPTNTTLPVEACEVVFRTSDAVKFGALQWTTHYSGGSFVGSFGSVECTSLVEGTLASFTDQDSTKILTSGMISLDGFDGPIDLASCSFEVTGDVQASDFDIVVNDATGTDTNPIEPLPEVTIASINCGGASSSAPSPLQRAPSAD